MLNLSVAELPAACSSCLKRSNGSSVPVLLRIFLSLLIPAFLVANVWAGSLDQLGRQRGVHKSRHYAAMIQRTSYGIPHITADNLPSAWFGQGYAMAEDRICALLDQMIKIRSERSRYFGPGSFNAYLDSDFGYKHLGIVAAAARDWAGLPADIRAMLSAHAAGINAYLADKGAAGLPQPCKNAEWVATVSPLDLFAYSIDVAMYNSGRFLIPFLSDAAPHSASALPLAGKAPLTLGNRETPPGSNGWGLGKEYSKSGSGMLLAQPHFPWEGELQSWESHVMVPGELDVYGSTLPGIPNMMVGFNKKVAWTLTVTTSPKATLYKLALVAGNPTQYWYDGEARAMTPSVYTIDVRNADGSIEQKSRTLYRSHYGPMLSIPGYLLAGFADYSWNESVAMSYRDANSGNRGFLSQFLAMSQARDLRGFIQAHRRWNSIPWSNTIAASSDGYAWYADSSPVPNLSPETYQSWQLSRFTDPGIYALYEFHGIYALDGSTSRDEWLESAHAAAPGLIPFAEAPQLLRPDYVLNANDSHWFINPEQLLEGYNPLYGLERSALSLRTRMNASALADLGMGGEVSLGQLQEAALSNHSFTGHLLRSELVERCKATPVVHLGGTTVDLSEACAILAAWDETFDLDSEGAVLFREFLGSFDLFGRASFSGEGAFFAEPFDPNDPIQTPRGLAGGSLPGSDDPVLVALGQAVQRLSKAGFALNSVLRDLQYAVKGGKRIPVHGGNSREGIMNLVGYTSNATLLPGTPRGTVINYNTGLTADGYVVNYGTSYLMAVELAAKGPQCRAITAYSQSADPESPYFSDQTVLFSSKQWRPCLYSRHDIQSDPELRSYWVKSKRK